jgi:hypothetical protein
MVWILVWDLGIKYYACQRIQQETKKTNYYLSFSLGTIDLDGHFYYCVDSAEKTLKLNDICIKEPPIKQNAIVYYDI